MVEILLKRDFNDGLQDYKMHGILIHEYVETCYVLVLDIVFVML